MNTIFRYPGGKSKESVRSKIFAHAPYDYSEYREPFVGGGGIFFAVPPRIRRWINDVHPGLIAVYAALKERPDEFIAKCREIEPAKPGEPEDYPKAASKGKKYNARLMRFFKEICSDETADQALRYFFVNRTVWAGRVNYDVPSRLYFSNPQGWNIVKTQKLDVAAKLMKRTKVTLGDYSAVLSAPGDHVWIYCDPPYYSDTERQRLSQLYSNTFSEADHIRLFEDVKKCKHKVMISYDDHERVRELATDARLEIIPCEWTYCGSSKESKETGKELILVNYPRAT